MRDTLPMDWPEDARTRRVGQVILLLWVLAAADLLFTLRAHAFTPFLELNPVARAMLAKDWLGGLVFYKVITTLLGTAIFWRLRGHARAEAALWGLAVVYVGLAVRWSNYTSDVLAMV